MVECKEMRLVPDMDSMHVMEGYENICEGCENWGEACEACDAFIPVVGNLVLREVTYRQMAICGIPVGEPYPVEG